MSVVAGLAFGANNTRTLSPDALREIVRATGCPRVTCADLRPYQVDVYRNSGILNVIPTPDGQEEIVVNPSWVQDPEDTRRRDWNAALGAMSLFGRLYPHGSL